MYIKVIASPVGKGHAYLYAWTRAGSEPAYKTEKEDTYSIRYSYPDTYITADKIKDSYIGDSFVILSCAMPFKRFCEKLAASDYGHPVNNEDTEYNHLENNCADSLIYALRLAGISLDIHNGDWGCKPCYSFGWGKAFCLTNFSTPLDVLASAKRYKIQALTAANYFIAMDLETKKLQEWIEASPAEAHKTYLASSILEDVNQCKDKHPEHSEEYLAALRQTYRLLMHFPTIAEKKAYTQHSHLFKQRPVNYSKNYPFAYLIWIFFIASVANMWENTNFIPGPSAAYLAGSGSLLALSCFCFFATSSKKIVPTKLSRAMESLVKVREQESPGDELHVVVSGCSPV